MSSSWASQLAKKPQEELLNGEVVKPVSMGFWRSQPFFYLLLVLLLIRFDLKNEKFRLGLWQNTTVGKVGSLKLSWSHEIE